MAFTTPITSSSMLVGLVFLAAKWVTGLAVRYRSRGVERVACHHARADHGQLWQCQGETDASVSPWHCGHLQEIARAWFYVSEQIHFPSQCSAIVAYTDYNPWCLHNGTCRVDIETLEWWRPHFKRNTAARLIKMSFILIVWFWRWFTGIAWGGRWWGGCSCTMLWDMFNSCTDDEQYIWLNIMAWVTIIP